MTGSTNALTMLHLQSVASHLNVRKFFPQRSVNDWNSLPRDITESPNVIIFKSKLRRCILAGFTFQIFR